jgi:hypothetical protein
MKRDKQREVFIKLIDMQMAQHGLTYEDIKNDPNFYINYATTPDNERKWKEDGIALIQKELKLSKKNAETEMAWVTLQWGLTIPSEEYPNYIHEKVTKHSTHKTS